LEPNILVGNTVTPQKKCGIDSKDAFQRQVRNALTVALPSEVRKLRQVRGWTQPKLARESRVSLSSVQRIESGSCVNLDLVTLLNLCIVFEVSPDSLTGFDQYWAMPGECVRCRAKLGETRHTVSDCIFWMSQRGIAPGRIAGEFGFTVAALEGILREEYRVRRVGKHH
jgi:transcriptional regulator with XRE-family HTH domain